MAKLLYAANASLDGWTEDARGAFDWAPLDDGVFAATTELMGAASTYLYGRRMYETMAVWETDPALAALSARAEAYARVWQAANKIVYSSSLATPTTSKTRLERRFDPDAVRQLKATPGKDLIIGGPHLAAQALNAALVDEVILFVWPIVLSGRNAALQGSARANLELLGEHRFGNGVVRLHYRVRSD